MYSLILRRGVGCVTVSIASFWDFVAKYYYLFGVMLIGAGGVLAFYGCRILKPVVIFSVGVVTMSILGSLLYTYVIPDNPEEWVNWLTLAILVSVGVGLGYLSLRILKAGIFLVGALGGVILGLMLYSTVIYKIQTDSQVRASQQIQ
ncbi:MAG: DUF4203 domain-containing protein [Candidatus Pacebacteria bacterium]|nr:DUF4203 domain-containing protein [Candidatus Paceibacterota bacterium]